MDLTVLLWMFAPAGIANMAPVVISKAGLLKSLDRPLDNGKHFRGKRVFGDHKTLRGIAGGALAGMIAAGLQVVIYALSQWPSAGPIDYGRPEALLFGLTIGFGAIAGDAVKSFFKRRVNIKPGQNWFPFDQIDFICGAIIVSTVFFVLSWQQYLALIIFYAVLHPITNIVSWLLKFQSKPL